MTIYVWRGAERIPLGTARAINETRLSLPSGMVVDATSLRFQTEAERGPAADSAMLSDRR
jgi:hypothetical protein